MTNLEDTYYIIGSVVGPHPYPVIVRDFQSVIGNESQAADEEKEGGLPDAVVACVGGGSNAMGTFHPFADDLGVKLYGVEAGGPGKGRNAAALVEGREGVLHGMMTYLLQDKYGQISEHREHLRGPGLPGRGPRALLPEGQRAGRPTSPSPTTRPSGLSTFSAGPRGHHPGARVVTRGRLRRQAGGEDEEGREHRGHALGTRRQGRADNRQAGRE